MEVKTFQGLSKVASSARSSDIRDLLHFAKQEGFISFAGGLPDPELFDVTGIKHAAQEVHANKAKIALQYGVTEGQPELRAALAKLMLHRGIVKSPDEVLVTTGSQQALDLIARVLIDEGDLVGIEAPTYLAAVSAFDLARPKYLCIPSTPEGMDVDWLVTSSVRPKILYVVPTFSNPTGASMSLQSRLKLLDWAAAHQVFIIEDDPYSELRFPSSPRLPSLYELANLGQVHREWVAYISTLSKVMAPGMRIGWILAPEEIYSAAVRVKQAMDLHTSTYIQEVAAEYLKADILYAAVERMRVTYMHRAYCMRDELAQAFGDVLEINQVSGGMFVWTTFHDSTNTRQLLKEAIRHKLIFVPGEAFYPGNTGPENELRLSFVSNPLESIREGVQRLKRAHQELHANAQATLSS